MSCTALLEMAQVTAKELTGGQGRYVSAFSWSMHMRKRGIMLSIKRSECEVIIAMLLGCCARLKTPCAYLIG